jgi:hypothetical protein
MGCRKGNKKVVFRMNEEEERLLLAESDVINLLLEFLGARRLTSSQVELERESGVVNELIPSTDLLFLRSLILDGRWEDVSEFLQVILSHIIC